MDYLVLTVSLGLFVVVLPCSSDMAVSRAQRFNEEDGLVPHEHKKRSIRYNLEDSVDDLVDRDEGLFPSRAEDDLEKKGGLFRFGKRQGSLFRFGKRQESQVDSDKRGSLFRFGKRYGNLFRFGKRGGSLFRFGRSGSGDLNTESLNQDKRTLFRFGKRSDLDLIRESMDQLKDLKSAHDMEEHDNKHGIDNSDWNNRFEHE
uniref:Lfrfamide 2 n=1 Tax=Deroceras reticulatum TaxID=145610 RepID=A0A1X9WEG7_DERRE|nr:lfrfamide 2 [Deroceras reticulatum]